MRGKLGWVVAGVILLVAATRPASDETRAKRLVIEDEQGRPRIVVETFADQPRIRMLTADGKLGWSAGIMPNGHGFTLAANPSRRGVQVP